MTAGRFYQLVRPLNYLFHYLSEVLGVRTPCKFPTSCSEYARHQLDAGQPRTRAFAKILWRLIYCSPLYGVFERLGLKPPLI